MKLKIVAAALAALFASSAYAEPKAGELWKEPNTGIEFVYIPAGCFDMGSDTGENDEKPVHRVCIKQAFMLSKYEITQEQYRTVMSSKPSNFSGDSNPVEKVSWDDAQAFARDMNNATGQRYRLPTEAEWEYACRAGGQHAQYCGQGFVDKLAWTSGNSDSKTHPVGQKSPNAWGLYDMSGNVWEWVQDWYVDGYYGAPTDGSAQQGGEHKYRVLRGGSWFVEPQFARAANRSGSDPARRGNVIGFRLARTLP